ncbi:MAG TPA: gluconate 2-dehydrogenase subunit 3 family protein [Gemmatimonadaceae bacterium]|nr:gluconate 2-dehydrogenase subunit 3 family protein [Gemmatimonadaceae bacterium]
MSDEQTPSMDRREAIKAIVAAAASASLVDGLTPAVAEAQQPVAITPRPKPGAKPLPTVGPRGTPTDPNLLNAKAAWPRLLSAGELATLTVLCDMIIPADDRSPSASSVGVPAYIDEYVSAPYDWAERALVRVRGGLGWLDIEGEKRFGKRFTALTVAQRTEICDDICYLPKAKPGMEVGARFFDQVRDLTASGFYCSAEGMKDLQYVGNVPLAKWDGPPPEVLKHLGLA